jgi:nitrate reductase gamma subunit
VNSHTLFAVVPYVAAGVLVALTLLRLAAIGRSDDRQERGLALRVLRGNRLWRVGLAGTLAGHVAVLLFPQMVLRWTASLPRLLAFEILWFLFAVAAAAGLVRVLNAHLRQHTLRSVRSLADGVVLGLLTVAIGSGLSMAVFHRWATSWSLVTVAPYIGSVLALRPEVELVEALPYLVKLHVFAAMAAVALLPLSHALDALLILASRLLSKMLAPVNVFSQRARARLEDGARRAAHAFWWPEEEEE